MNFLTRTARAVSGALVSVFKSPVPRALQGLEGGGWRALFSTPEWFFDRDIHPEPDTVFAHWTVFSCMTLIAGDVGKMRIKLQEQIDNIPTETQSPAFSPVLRKPNHFQTRQKFIESWVFSKISRGNAYILKERDNRDVVIRMYVLDPARVKPLVAESGDVYYELHEDNLSHIPGPTVTVPASEIIHDRMWCLFHPLVGLSPIFASLLAASQGLKIQKNSALFFENMSRPSGVLSAPAKISDESAARLKKHWEENYRGGQAGKVAVLGDGLKYEPMGQTAVDSQLVEQLKMSAEMICSTFHVPAYKVGVGAMPTYQNADILNQIYYDTCLQPLIEAIEAELNEGLGLSASKLETEFDLDSLLRMDRATQVKVLAEEVGGGITAPNEARAKLNRGPKPGGDSPMMQQQNYSLEALAKRDASNDPFGTAAPPAPAESPPPAKDFSEDVRLMASTVADLKKQLEESTTEAAELEGAKEFASMLIRKFNRESVCG